MFLKCSLQAGKIAKWVKTVISSKQDGLSCIPRPMNAEKTCERNYPLAHTCIHGHRNTQIAKTQKQIKNNLK